MDFTSTKPTPKIQHKPMLLMEEAKALAEQYFNLEVHTIQELNSYEDRNYYLEAERRRHVCSCGHLGSKGGGSEDRKNGGLPKTNLAASVGYSEVGVLDVNENCDGIKNGYERTIGVQKFIFKILNSFDSATNHVEAEHAAMRLLHSKGVVCPLPISNIYNQDYWLQRLRDLSGRESDHVVRLLRYVPGNLLQEVDCNINVLIDIGSSLSVIDKALEDFEHKALDDMNSVWDLKNLLSIRSLLSCIKVLEKRRLVERVINTFQERVLPYTHLLSKGTIHSDYNEQNVIVDPETSIIVGVIDFGDLMSSCYVFELASAIFYASLLATSLPRGTVGAYVLAGYLQHRRLTPFEISLLPICTAARTAQSLTIGCHSFELDPRNEYLLSSANEGWKFLGEFTEDCDYDEMAKEWISVAHQCLSKQLTV